MNCKIALKTLETAMERCTALQVELTEKVPPDERNGRFMRTFEVLDLLEHSLIQAAKELKEEKD
jgi:hypothetical protein